jgi:hypothetical protein
MEKVEEIKRVLAGHKRELRQRFKVKSIGVFGSFVRGEERKASDVDILVSLWSLWGFLSLLRWRIICRVCWV